MNGAVTAVERRYDVVIIGAGSGGITLAGALVEAGKSVAVIAAGFVGGECPFVACMPSKSLLRSARARTEARELVPHGGAADAVDVGADWAAWHQAVIRRDETANRRDDSAEAESLQKSGVEVIRGFGVLRGAGAVEVDGVQLGATHVVLDTGSVPVIPEIEGLENVPTWTSDQALSSAERPDRMIILGGGPIGCELAQAYAAFGVQVTIVDASDRLIPGEDRAISAQMLQVQRAAGVAVALGRKPARVEPGDGGLGLRMHLADDTELTADRLLVVVGRRPAVDGLGLETSEARRSESGAVETDDRCAAAPGLWAIGDVTGLAPYTHTANHQARVVADAILGRPGHAVSADALPRAVFTEPPVGATGLTEAQAHDRGIDAAVVEVDLAEVSRAGAEGEGPLGPENASGGILRLIADRRTRLLVGASAIGPQADAWIGEATLAIRAGVPIEILADVVRPFPTYPEAYTLAYDQLLDQM